MRILASLLLASAFLAGPPAVAGAMATHRALYDLNLHPGNSTDMAGVDGTLAYEWADACTGWTTSEKADLKLYYRDGHSQSLGWSLNSWESKDGLSYRFLVRDFADGTTTAEYKGSAALDGPGAAGKARFEEPKAETVALPAGTLFPTAHSATLLHHLAVGDRQLYATVFDGTDDKQLFGISAVLSATGEPRTDAAALSPLLAKGPVYRLALAFFSDHGDNGTPDQEQMVDLYANGITDRLTLDYGQFSVDAVLKTIAALPAPGC